MRTLAALILGVGIGGTLGAGLTYRLVAPTAPVAAEASPRPVFLSPGATITTPSGVMFTMPSAASGPRTAPPDGRSFGPPVRVPAGTRPPTSGVIVMPGNSAQRGLPPDISARMELARRAASASAAELDAMIDAAAANRDEATRRGELSTLLQRLAMHDADRAMRRAVDLGNAIERGAWTAILRNGVRTNPNVITAALDHVRNIRDARLRDDIAGAALGAWASEDPVAAFEYLDEHADELGLDLSRPLAYVGPGVSLDPRAALGAADRLRPEIARALRSQALSRLVRDDPRAAIDYLATADVRGAERQSLVRTIADGYATVDVERALDWARSESAEAETQVLTRLAQVNPRRAVALALQGSPGPTSDARVANVVNAAARAPGADLAELAEMVVAAPRNAASSRALQNLLGTWAQNDAPAALEWLARAPTLPVDVYRGVAMQATPRVAAAHTDRVPPEMRSDWIRSVAPNYARAEPRAAIDWIERFRGEPVYEDAVTAAVQGLAASEPRAAVRLLDGLSEQRKAIGYSGVATQWTQQDPAAAADWAAGIREPNLASQALRSVVQQWAALDSRAAEGWAFRLPSGASRDAVLTALVNHHTYAARSASPDDPIWSAFNDSMLRQRAVLQVVVGRLRQSDPEAARRLLDRHVTDPALRASAERSFGPAPSGLGEPRVIRFQ